MKYLIVTALSVVVAVGVACSSSQRAQTKVERKPLEKQRREYKSPANYRPREFGYDPKTGKVMTYDHKPRVELSDEKTGKYSFKWIGLDGKEKAVVFQRGDVLDVVVRAVVSKTPTGQYVYSYTVENQPTSATYLKRFVLQNFAPDVAPAKGGPLVPFTMSPSIYQFREGNLLSFDDVSDSVQINPGQTVEVRLTSSAPPGLVECRASIENVMEGAGEDMPSALENLLPGYDDFPKGYTIGPVEYLKGLSSEEKAKYVGERLSQLRVLGWITDETAARYEQELKSNGLRVVAATLNEDLQSEQITSEVAALINGLI